MEALPADSATVTSDWPCAVCSYNLRELSRTGRCPECGTPVAKSLKVRYLRGLGQAWLRSVRRGITASIFSDFGMIAVSTITIVAALDIRWYSLVRISQAALPRAGSMALNLYGIWRFTTPQKDRVDWAAKLARASCAIVVVLSLVYYFQPPWMHTVTGIGIHMIAAVVVAMIGDAAIFHYLAMLALRLPDPLLARRFATLRWLVPAVVGVTHLPPWCVLVLWRPYYMRYYLLLAWPGLIARPVTECLTLLCVWQFRRQLNRAISEST
jgi:hypothetical protein